MNLESIADIFEAIKELFDRGGAPFVYAILFGIAVYMQSQRMLKYIEKTHEAEIRRMSNQLNWFRNQLFPERLSTDPESPSEED